MAKFRFIDPDEQGRDPFASEDQNTTEFETMLEAEKDIPFGKKLKTGEGVSGVVVSVGAEFVFVDFSIKYDLRCSLISAT